MPVNDEKMIAEMLTQYEDQLPPGLKGVLDRYFQKAYFYEDSPKVHVRRTLKSGVERTYYMFKIPVEAVEKGKVDPNRRYRIELYPLEEESEEKK